MKRIISAIESGRCVLGVSGSLLRDQDVMYEVSRREGLPVVALSGPATKPVQEVADTALLRVTAQAGGVLVLVDPEMADQNGLKAIAEILRTAQHTPTVLVVARNYNPLMFGMMFSGVPTAHLKDRGKPFFGKLPIPPAELANVLPAVEKALSKKKSGPDAPAYVFVGREDELATLGGFLGEGGPIVVSGPAGVGKTQLVAHAIDSTELTRTPRMNLGRGSGADTLYALLASLTADAGSDELSRVLKDVHTPQQAIDAAIASLKAAESLSSKVLVVEDLHWSAGREGDFFHKGRLEMLLEALLTNTYPLRIVFTSRIQPVFYREGVANGLKRLEVKGLKGRFLHEIFQAYKAPEFAREHFGPMAERIHGHPMVARAYAIVVRDREDGVKLAEDAKFMKVDALTDVGKLEKRLQRQVEKVQGPLREALAAIAHLREPVDGKFLAALKITRKERLELLAQGLLDALPAGEERWYRVHPLVQRCFKLREITNFDIAGHIANLYSRRANDAAGVEALALKLEANRYLRMARRFRDVHAIEFHDHDPLKEDVLNLLRSRSRPNPHLAEQRITEGLNADPSNDDLWLLRLELMENTEGTTKDAFDALFTDALDKAPVPEIAHKAVDFYLRRRARKKAIGVLETAIEKLPNEPRLRTRLAVLQLREGRRNEAIEHLRKAMEIAPMLPDAYGILGMARRDEGAESTQEAEDLLREAVRLAPNDTVQTSRLADLLLDRARSSEGDARQALLNEAREMLDLALKEGRKSPDAQILLAQIIREASEDYERVVWLLKQAKKNTERNRERLHRIFLEFALTDLARGDVDSAESTLQGLTDKDQTDHKIPAALAQVHEARGLLIPAYAELKRAVERTPAMSFARHRYEAELARLQAAIELQAANMAAGLEPAPVVASKTAVIGESDQPLTAPAAPRTIRRAKEGEAAPVEAAPVDAAPVEAAPVEAAPVEAAPVEAAAPVAVEAAPEAAAEAPPEA